jgi:prepilin-type N-terminal cleavage/methylation domain-containing protein
MKNKGFTIVELAVVIGIIGILAAIIMFSISQYISKGKDSNVAGNLSVLVPAGENYYNVSNNSYANFCTSDVFKNAISQMAKQASGTCYNSNVNPSSWTGSSNPANVCCNVSTLNNAWAACAREFTNPSYAYCVDSRGVKQEITVSSCAPGLTQCGS